MFDTFTEAARQAMGHTRRLAQDLSHEYLGVEHLLVGLVLASDRLQALLRDRYGVTVDSLREEVQRRVPPGPDKQSRGYLPFTPRAKHVMEQALIAATQAASGYRPEAEVSAELLFAALAAEKDGVAAELLESNGIRTEDVNAALGIPEFKPIEVPQHVDSGSVEERPGMLLFADRRLPRATVIRLVELLSDLQRASGGSGLRIASGYSVSAELVEG